MTEQARHCGLIDKHFKIWFIIFIIAVFVLSWYFPSELDRGQNSARFCATEPVKLTDVLPSILIIIISTIIIIIYTYINLFRK